MYKKKFAIKNYNRMKAYVFLGQELNLLGWEDLYEQSEVARTYFEKANEILGFRITDLMFDGTTKT